MKNFYDGNPDLYAGEDLKKHDMVFQRGNKIYSYKSEEELREEIEELQDVYKENEKLKEKIKKLNEDTQKICIQHWQTIKNLLESEERESELLKIIQHKQSDYEELYLEILKAKSKAKLQAKYNPYFGWGRNIGSQGLK